MQYQLVLQFAGDSVVNYDTLVAIEHQLMAALGGDTVDGHDMGSGEANIFILTPAPQKTFRQVAPVLEGTGYMPAVTAAYRRVNEDRYHVLWPENCTRQFSVA